MGQPCKLWHMSCTAGGYGQVVICGDHFYVHRLEWEMHNGPIPNGFVIDHTCRVRSCYEITHLRLVTPAVNATENSTSPAALNKVKTHCKRGHPFTPENTRISTRRTGSRVCKTCHREKGKIKNG